MDHVLTVRTGLKWCTNRMFAFHGDVDVVLERNPGAKGNRPNVVQVAEVRQWLRQTLEALVIHLETDGNGPHSHEHLDSADHVPLRRTDDQELTKKKKFVQVTSHTGCGK